MQDFIYLKYYNQIPNNYMITLRRYTRPCEDHMFGLDMPAEYVASMNNYTPDYFALATAVTYMGEKTGNKLSDILKFDYGANWKYKEAEELVDHMLRREVKREGGTESSRIQKGDKETLVKLLKLAKKKVPVEYSIYIVQPGVSKESVSDEILTLLGVTDSYLKDKTGIDLQVITS